MVVRLDDCVESMINVHVAHAQQSDPQPPTHQQLGGEPRQDALHPLVLLVQGRALGLRDGRRGCRGCRGGRLSFGGLLAAHGGRRGQGLRGRRRLGCPCRRRCCRGGRSIRGACGGGCIITSGGSSGTRRGGFGRRQAHQQLVVEDGRQRPELPLAEVRREGLHHGFGWDLSGASCSCCGDSKGSIFG